MYSIPLLAKAIIDDSAMDMFTGIILSAGPCTVCTLEMHTEAGACTAYKIRFV